VNFKGAANMKIIYIAIAVISFIMVPGNFKRLTPSVTVCAASDVKEPLIEISLVQPELVGKMYRGSVTVKNVGTGEFRGIVGITLKDGERVVMTQKVSYADDPIPPHSWRTIQVETVKKTTSAEGYIDMRTTQ